MSAVSLFDAVGGAEGVVRLAHAWHERVLADEIVSHAFSHGFHPQHTERLAAYWGESWGGPSTYSASMGSESSAVRMHSGHGHHEEMDRRAIACFDKAMEDIGLADPQLRRVLHDYFAWTTTARMSGYPHSADDVPHNLSLPIWSWDGLQKEKADTQAIEQRSDSRTIFIAAKPAQVFAAMSDPTRIARWWGPDGFTNTIHQFDFQAGGSWLLTMHGPDGKDYPNESRFARIVPNELFEIEHLGGHHNFMLTIELRPNEQGTQVYWRQTFDTVEHYDEIAQFVAGANEQNLRRLAAEVARPD
jgi:hemoglobin